MTAEDQNVQKSYLYHYFIIFIMDKEKAIVGFIGAGGIARSHAYALNSLRYYYNNIPEIELAAVCSASEASRAAFAGRFGFTKPYSIEDFTADKRINTVFI